MSQSRPRVTPRLAGLLLVTVTLAFLFAEVGSVATQARPTALADRHRFGFVATTPGWREKFDLAQLGAGWSVDFGPAACSTRPEGIDHFIVIYVWPDYVLDHDKLGPMVDRHPGTTWIIGNEPDCIWQSNLEPDVYAHMYHELYTFIKGRDASSKLSPGGIVQATPLRLEWLDLVLAEYDRVYGGLMPVDVWNIHNAIVNEKRGGWGADIPPGIDADVGILRSPYESDNMEIFEEQIWTFRQWMEDRGYVAHPLVISEFGILMANGHWGFDEAKVNAFMYNAFDFLVTAVDPVLGDPNDGNRLVQRWAWFSLDWPAYDPVTAPQGFNGGLFDPVTTDLTGFGQHYANYISGLPALEHIDLSVGVFRVLPPPSPGTPTGPMTQILRLEIRNEGNLASGPFTVELEYNGPVSGVLDQQIDNMPPGSSRWLTFTLTAVEQGVYDVSVWIDRSDEVIESAVCNNQMSRRIAVPPVLMYLPIVVDGAP
jgi:hypothetical protein